MAAKIGLPPEQVFKTLAVEGGPEWNLFGSDFRGPGTGFQGARKTDKRSEDRNGPLKEVQALTGYIRGGVTALACKKDYPVYIDELAEICDVISVSAGIRGLQILIAPAD